MRIVVVLVLSAINALPAQDRPQAVRPAGTEPTIKSAPYSAEAITETTQTLADGTHIARSSSEMVNRDTEGRERREISLPPGPGKTEPSRMVTITDPVAGVRYRLDSISHLAHRTLINRPAQPQFANSASVKLVIEGGITITGGVITPGSIPVGHVVPREEPSVVTPAPQVVEFPASTAEQLGSKTIEGVEAEGTRTVTTITAGQIGNDRDLVTFSERWFSPELSVVVMTIRDDPRSGRTVYRLSKINRVEPDHSLFEVPPEYKIAEDSGAAAGVRQ